MANPPPPYDNITGISRTVMKDNAQETLGNYNGNARPGEIVADLTTDPPALYVGNNLGQLTAIGSGGGGGSLPLANGSSNFDIATVNGNVTITVAGLETWTFDNLGNLNYPDGTISTGGATYSAANASVQMISNNAYNQVRVDNANVEIYTSLNGITLKQWTFDGAGNLTLPLSGNIVGATANNNGYINWVGNSSGDGGGYTTMNIVPDDTRVASDQYLIIDPTAPGHIHIRAGGTQDNSSAELYLGGENSYFKVASGSNPDVSISANSKTWTYHYGALGFPVLQYANLTAIVGSRAFINDANLVAASNFGAQVSGGGSNAVPVWSDGINWFIG